MAVLDQINADFQAARLSKDAVAAPLLGTLIGNLTNLSKSFKAGERPLTEAEVIAQVKTLLDGVDKTLALIQDDPSRSIQRAQYAREREVLSKYVPEPLTEAEIEAFFMARRAALDLGGLMAALKAAHPGQYDGKLASTVARRVLA